MPGMLGRNTWLDAKTRYSPLVAWNTLRIRETLTLSRLEVLLSNEACFVQDYSPFESIASVSSPSNRIEGRNWPFEAPIFSLLRKTLSEKSGKSRIPVPDLGQFFHRFFFIIFPNQIKTISSQLVSTSVVREVKKQKKINLGYKRLLTSSRYK